MESRVRMGFKPTAKGTVNIDVTAEAETPEEAAKLLSEGIEAFKKEASLQGYPVNEGAGN